MPPPNQSVTQEIRHALPTTVPHAAPPVAAPEADQEFALRAALAPQGYLLRRRLGGGGMGVVYEAEQTRLKRRVALKVIRQGPYADPESLARFHTEAEACARLQHPHIVQVFDHGDCDGQGFLVLELVEGGNLRDRLRAGPLPAPRAAAALLRPLAEAVHYAHGQGVVHRDLKPANILLTPDGRPKVADFGLARLLDGGAGLTREGAILGTPSYMSPEQAGGQSGQVGPAADVYALGAVFYDLLTGRPPLEGLTTQETLARVVTAAPTPPRQLRPEIPRDLQAVCLRCLEKDPARRYASAAALAADLTRFLAGHPLQARPESDSWFARKLRQVQAGLRTYI